MSLGYKHSHCLDTQHWCPNLIFSQPWEQFGRLKTRFVNPSHNQIIRVKYQHRLSLRRAEPPAVWAWFKAAAQQTIGLGMVWRVGTGSQVGGDAGMGATAGRVEVNGSEATGELLQEQGGNMWEWMKCARLFAKTPQLLNLVQLFFCQTSLRYFCQSPRCPSPHCEHTVASL